MTKYIAYFVVPPEAGIESVLVEGETIDEARAMAERRALFWKPTPSIGDLEQVLPGSPLEHVEVQR